MRNSSNGETDREKIQALLNGEVLHADLQLPGNHGMMIMYIRLNKDGQLVEGTIDGDRGPVGETPYLQTNFFAYNRVNKEIKVKAFLK
jgi:hypothetical protein